MPHALALGHTYAEFVEEYPTYLGTTALDDLRAKEFGRLDQSGQVYLDYTGGSLYAACQVRQHSESLAQGVFGNPHSNSPTSVRSADMMDACRRRILRFFNASPDEYGVVFTANASQALKLVGESYPFQPGDCFLLTFDNHNSVNGIREFDRVRGAKTVYVPALPPDLRADDATLAAQLGAHGGSAHRLLAYPAQSNFSGVQHPLEWITDAQQRGWDVLLDAAAFVPTNRLDLSAAQPDYVALSFYKMFGYPTGIGVLLARWPALEKLHRPWFSGGTVAVASVQGDRHFLETGAAAFEDGTLDYLNIPAIELGLDLLDSVGIETVHERVACLTSWLMKELLRLRHSSGGGLVRIYGPTSMESRGGTLAFNFYTESGAVIDHNTVEEMAAGQGISLRTGCFCNPGAGEVALGIGEEELTRCFAAAPDRMDRDDLMRCINADSSGAVRVSLGWVSNFADVHRFLEFAKGFRS